jgi:hypothetical protein
LEISLFGVLDYLLLLVVFVVVLKR